MIFINPIEVLALNNVPISSIDNTLIKKAKRKLFADIDLSDNGLFSYMGKSFAKSDLELVINELEDQEKLEFYYFISEYEELQQFLTRPDENFILHFKHETMFKLTSFINFISPYYSISFDKLGLNIYLKEDNYLFKKLNSTPLLVSPTDIPKSYNSLSNYLKASIKAFDDIIAELRNKTTGYTSVTIPSVFNTYKKELSAERMNALPSLLQDLKNEAGLSFRNFSIHVYNYFDDTNLSLQAIKYALLFDVNAITQQKLNENFEEINQLRNAELERQRNEPILKKYAEIIKTGRNLTDQVNSKSINATSAIYWVNSTIQWNELNGLPNSLMEIKSQIALTIKGLSVAVWNTYSDIDTAIRLIDKSLLINTTDQEVKKIINEAKTRLSVLKAEITLPIYRPTQSLTNQTPSFPSINKPTINKTIYSQPPKKSTGSGWILFGIVLLVIVIIIVASNSSRNSVSTNYTNADSVMKTDTVSKIADTTKMQINTASTSTANNSKYIGNSLRTGASPFNSCFGEGTYNSNSWIEVTNDNSTDAIVCLVDSVTDQVIRNKYIKAGKFYKMKKVPDGFYYLKIYSGNDWNPELKNGCSTNGAFESNVNFSSSKAIYRCMEVTDNGLQFSTFTLSLSQITNSSFNNQSNLQSTFFNTNKLQ